MISDGTDTFVPGIMEHVERAGVHSGDSMAVYPPVSLSTNLQSKMVEYACLLAKDLGIRGMMNIQFVLQGEEVFVLEVNPRASRTVPYLSKVTGIPMVNLATRCAMGETLADMGYASGYWELNHDSAPNARFDGSPCAPRASGEILPASEVKSMSLEPVLYAVKAPVFSFQKLGKVEPSLGPEMKSTGEVLGIDSDYHGALYKALIASGIQFKPKGLVILTVNDADKVEIVDIARKLVDRGYTIGATSGTQRVLDQEGIACELLKKIQDGSPNLLESIYRGEVSLMVNTPEPDQKAGSEAARIRRACIETGVPCVTSIDTARALTEALDVFENPEKAGCKTVSEYVRSW